jgi:hypothetical protein
MWNDLSRPHGEGKSHSYTLKAEPGHIKLPPGFKLVRGGKDGASIGGGLRIVRQQVREHRAGLVERERSHEPQPHPLSAAAIARVPERADDADDGGDDGDDANDPDPEPRSREREAATA